jgi:hypothetical protein
MPMSGTNSKYQLTPDDKEDDLKEEAADKDSRKREVCLIHFTLAGILLTLRSTIDLLRENSVSHLAVQV